MELLEWMPPSGSQLAQEKAFLVPISQALQSPLFSAPNHENMTFKGKMERFSKLPRSIFDHYEQK
jgi:hypothetical protein